LSVWSEFTCANRAVIDAVETLVFRNLLGHIELAFPLVLQKG